MDKQAKIIIGVIIAITVIAIGYGIYKKSNQLAPTEPAITKPAEKEVIKIGAPLSLTGKLASFGEDIRDGIDMAVDEINQQKKIKIEIIYEDTQSEATQAVSAVKKLIEINNVNILLGPCRSDNVLAVAPITEKKKVILFTSIASSVDITNAGDYVFRNRETSKLSGEKMAEFLVSKEINKVAVFTAQSATSLSYQKFFIERFKKLGKEIVFSTEYSPSSLDFKTNIAKAKSAGSEAFYLSATVGADAGILTKQIRELGFSGLISGSNAFGTEEFLNGAGATAEGVFLTSPAFNVENPDIQNYRDKYKELYNKKSNAYAANAYDAVKILANAIEYCSGDKDTDCIRDFLYSVKDYQGIGGKTTFDKNGDVIKPVMIKVVKDGKFVPYEE